MVYAIILQCHTVYIYIVYISMCIYIYAVPAIILYILVHYYNIYDMLLSMYVYVICYDMHNVIFDITSTIYIIYCN